MKNPLYSGSVKDFLNQAPKSIEGLEKELTQERQRTNYNKIIEEQHRKAKRFFLSKKNKKLTFEQMFGWE